MFYLIRNYYLYNKYNINIIFIYLECSLVEVVAKTMTQNHEKEDIPATQMRRVLGKFDKSSIGLASTSQPSPIVKNFLPTIPFKLIMFNIRLSA